MLKVGLTGGIASGKTAASDGFAARGVPVVDADVIARQVVEPGQPALAEIRRRFGDSVLGADGTLNRPALRDLVFADSTQRRALEAILHPRIKEAMRSQLAGLETPYCVVVVPLLIEAGQQDLVDRILVVDAPRELRIARLMQRDGTTRAQAQTMLAAQLDSSARLAQADDVIVNAGTRSELDAAIEKLHRKYLALATHG